MREQLVNTANHRRRACTAIPGRVSRRGRVVGHTEAPERPIEEQDDRADPGGDGHTEQHEGGTPTFAMADHKADELTEG